MGLVIIGSVTKVPDAYLTDGNYQRTLDSV